MVRNYVGARKTTLITAIVLVCSSVVLATDPSLLQDFCVAANTVEDSIFVNGKFCKDPSEVTADDFFSSALRTISTTYTKQGSVVTPVFVDQLGGLNTLGIAIASLDFAPYGVNPPHIHPRASEILTVVDGTLLVGLVTSNPPGGRNRIFTKVLYKGDLFVFPQGLVHFQRNIGKTTARAIVTFSSQNPGIVTIATAVFGSMISDNVLEKAFQVDSNTIKQLEEQFN